MFNEIASRLNSVYSQPTIGAQVNVAKAQTIFSTIIQVFRRGGKRSSSEILMILFARRCFIFSSNLIFALSSSSSPDINQPFCQLSSSSLQFVLLVASSPCPALLSSYSFLQIAHLFHRVRVSYIHEIIYFAFS